MKIIDAFEAKTFDTMLTRNACHMLDDPLCWVFYANAVKIIAL